MKALKENLIEILLQNKLVTKEQLDHALEIQKSKGISLRKVLVQEKLISEDELLSLLSSRLYIPTLHLAKFKFDQEIVKLIPEHTSRQYQVIAFSRIGNKLTVAMSDPLNIFAVDDLKVITGCDIDIVLSPEDEIDKAIEAQYGGGGKGMEDILREDALRPQTSSEKQEVELMKEEEIELSTALKESERPLIVKIVDIILI